MKFSLRFFTILMSSFFLGLFLFSPSEISAQATGQYSCIAVPNPIAPELYDCIPNHVNTCDSVKGYVPGDACEKVSCVGADCPGCVSMGLINCVSQLPPAGQKFKCIGGSCALGTCEPAKETCYDDAAVCKRNCGGVPPRNDAYYCDNTGAPTPDGKTTQSFFSAIGCIPLSSFPSFTTFLFKWALGIAGGIAMVLFIVSGLMIMTSSGDPDRLTAGKDVLTSAIAGIVLVIFSIIALKIIGIDILGI